jgi:YVTN family beta-propeller protein
MRSAVSLSSIAARIAVRIAAVCCCLPFHVALHPAAGAEDAGSARLRYPVALTLIDQGRLLVAANQRSGSLSVVDPVQGKLLSEWNVGRRLSDVTNAGGWLLVTDEQTHELLVVSTQADQLSVEQRLPVSPYPVKVVASRDGRFGFVASLWSRQISIVQLPTSTGEPAQVTAVLDLPYAPRELLLLRDDTLLLVADSFGGRLGIVDIGQGKLQRVREFPAHNIRGLALNVDQGMLIVTHQMLNSLAHTVRNDVHWGLLMSNDLRWLKLNNLLDSEDDLYRGAHMHPLGEAGSAAGDPAGVAVASDGTVVVALSGVNQVALGKEDDFSLARLPVGKRPVAVVASADGRQAFVANMFSDSLSVVDLQAKEVTAEISLGPQPDPTQVEQGERLFYDARLSHDSWMSCHSCHTDGHTNGLLNDNFSDKSFGAPKRVLSLLGRQGTAPFAWNGAAPDLGTQIRNSSKQTMQSDEPLSEAEVAALAAFVLTLEPPPSLDKLRGRTEPKRIARGKELFSKLACTDCHAPPIYTTADTYDVGLQDDLGQMRFNPPSLRGVGQRGPYFHDNRAATLADVFQRHQHQLSQPLDQESLADLLAFLRSL